MSKTISILRFAILALLAAAGMILLFSEEQDATTSAFILHVVADKAIAIALLFSVSRLYKRWSRAEA